MIPSGFCRPGCDIFSPSKEVELRCRESREHDLWEVNRMKHRVTIETETRKHFLGVPYTATEKRHIMVDGKTCRKMKREEREA